MDVQTYRYGGMTIRSEVALPGCTAVEAEVSSTDITISLRSGSPPDALEPVFAWPGRYGLSLLRHADGWLVTTRSHGAIAVSPDGCHLHCYADRTATDWADLITRRVLPRLMQLRGRLLLHAGSVSDGAHAHLLLGRSGSGKSTLTAALHRFLQWDVMTDDHAVIDDQGGEPMCHASAASLCLWPDSGDRVGLTGQAGRLVLGHPQKRWHDLAAPTLIARPVASIIFLADRDATGAPVTSINVSPLTRQEAIRLTYAAMMFFDPTDTAARQQGWSRVGRLIETVPSYVLAYPRRYDMIPDLCAAAASLAAASVAGAPA